MTISFWGSSLVSAYWNGAATYYRGILRDLARRGHQITFFEPDAYDRQSHRDIPDPEWARIVVYDAENEEELNGHLHWSAGCDVVVKASGVGVLDDELEARISCLPPSVCKVFWDVDAPSTLERLAGNPDDPFHRALERFDAVFTYGGGQRVTDEYRKRGAKLCHAIYNALDPDTHFPVDPEPNFSGDLSFLGNRLPDREARVDEYFFRAATCAPEKQFLLGGNGWGDKPKPANVHYLGHVYTNEHNTLNCSARAVLNISRDSMARYGFSPATRVFEAAGAAACIITDRWEGIDYFFVPDEEILIAQDGEEVAAILRGLDPDRARAIGENARRRVLREHTYTQRVTLVEAMLKETLSILPRPVGMEA